MRRFWAVCLVAMVSAGGCGGDDAGTGSPGSGGSGGSAGGGGTAGTGGTAGAGGSAGTGGTAGAGGSAGTGGTAGAGGSAGTGGTAGSGGCGPTCGSAPYQCFDPVMATLNAGAVNVTTNICPGTNISVPDQGSSQIRVQRAVPFFFIGTDSANLTAFTPEFNISVGLLAKMPAGFMMIAPTIPPAIDAGWNAGTKAYIGVLVSSTKSGATAPCNVKSGVTFAVTGHSEAVVHYDGGGSSTNTTSAAQMTIVTTGTVAAPEYVIVTATKSSCVLGLEASAALFSTGRAPVAINVATSTVAFEISN